jgi:WD40 repeat protein
MVEEPSAWPTLGTARLDAGALSSTGATFTAHGRLLILAIGRTIQVYRIQLEANRNNAEKETIDGRWTRQRRLQAHEGRVTSVAVPGPNNIFRALSASLDGTLRLWDLEEGSLLRTIDLGVPIQRCVIPSDQERYSYVLCSAADSTLPASSPDATMEPATATTRQKGKESGHHPADEGAMGSSWMKASPRRARGRSSFVARVDLQYGRWKILFHMPHGLACMDMSADGRLLAATSEQQVYLWRSEAPGDSRHWEHSGAMITSLCVDGVEEKIAVGDARGVITIYHMQSLAPETEQEHKRIPQRMPFSQRWHWHARPVRALLFRAQGKILLSGGHEGVLVEWHRVQTGDQSTRRRFYPRLGGVLEAIAFDEQTQTCAITLRQGCLTLLHLPSYTCLGMLRTLACPRGYEYTIWRTKGHSETCKAPPGDSVPSGRARVRVTAPICPYMLSSWRQSPAPVLVYSSPDQSICFHRMLEDVCMGVLKGSDAIPNGPDQDLFSDPLLFAMEEKGRFMVTAHEETPLRERWPNQRIEERTSRQVKLTFWSAPTTRSDETAQMPLPMMDMDASVTLAHRAKLVLLVVRQTEAFTLDESGKFYQWSWSVRREENPPAKGRAAYERICCTATATLQSHAALVRAVLSSDASVLVTIDRDGFVSIFALGESIRLVQMTHLDHLVDTMRNDAEQRRASAASVMELDAIDLVESGQLVLSVHGEQVPPQLIVYDIHRADVRWRLPLSVSHLVALHPHAALREVFQNIDLPLDGFAVAVPAGQAVLIFRSMGEPEPAAVWKLPLGSRPCFLLTHALMPLAVIDESAHLHLPSGPLGAAMLTTLGKSEPAAAKRQRLSFWHEALPPAWYEQIPAPMSPDRAQEVSPAILPLPVLEQVPAFTPVEPLLDALLARFTAVSHPSVLDFDQPTGAVSGTDNEGTSIVGAPPASRFVSGPFVAPSEWSTVLRQRLDRFRQRRQQQLANDTT